MAETTLPPLILDCTIRDGSYAIDFKFTAADTALIGSLLDGAGVPYIEIGHGLGLGAGAAGHGRGASDDLEVIGVTRARVPRSRLGCFFIPGIGTADDLRGAAAAGLDFVRIGQNADEIEQAWPFVELARELGLEPFVNAMKTYGISVGDFARDAAQAETVGARGFYVVDSAGGMMPREVAEYVEAARAASGLDIGFHGHSNLHLAVANSLAAVDAGARFVDTSVYGIGRSSGNTPTEVFVAVLDRLGIDSGVDLLSIMAIADSYLKPLMAHLHPHDMIAVSLGYGRFHSSYLPRALAAAREAGVNPFALVIELGRRDPMRLSDELLAEVVTERTREAAPSPGDGIAGFSDPRFQPRRIANRPQAVAELIDGLEVVAAKRGLQVVLDLVVSPLLDEETVTAEFVLEDEFMAFGRIRAGESNRLLDALAPHVERVHSLLLDVHGLSSSDVRRVVAELGRLSSRPPFAYRARELELEFLADAAVAITAVSQVDSVVIVKGGGGWYSADEVEMLRARLAAIVAVELVSEFPAGRHVELAVVPEPARRLQKPSGVALALYLGEQRFDEDPVDDSVVVLNRTEAYRNILPRVDKSLDLAASVLRDAVGPRQA